METKSRYEVIADLENNKRSLIREKEALGEGIIQREKQIKALRREVEDKEEELEEYKASLDTRKATVNELIKTLDDSLQRLSSMQKKE